MARMTQARMLEEPNYIALLDAARRRLALSSVVEFMALMKEAHVSSQRVGEINWKMVRKVLQRQLGITLYLVNGRFFKDRKEKRAPREAGDYVYFSEKYPSVGFVSGSINSNGEIVEAALKNWRNSSGGLAKRVERDVTAFNRISHQPPPV